jgi:toxin ParE1/3/4
MGEAYEWYESRSPGLGEEFIAAIDLQLKRLEQAPLLYAETIPGVRRALLPRFPYGVFYATRKDLIHVLAVIHNACDPRRWPKGERANNSDKDGMRPEYPEELIKSGVRGKYAKQYREGTNIALIDPDLHRIFPDSESVNRALRESLSERQPNE